MGEMAKLIRPGSENLLSVTSVSSINGTYVDDFNICRLDDTVRKYLRGIAAVKIPDLTKESIRIQALLATSDSMSIVKKKDLENRLRETNKLLEEYKEGKKLKAYIAETDAIVDAYAEMGLRKSTSSFLSRKTENVNQRNDERRRYIIAIYLEKAKKYMAINISREAVLDTRCEVCQYDMADVLIEPNGNRYCPGCGYGMLMLGKGTNINEIIRTGVTQKEDSKDKANFEKALLYFQCKQPRLKFPKDLWKDLDEYFMSHHIPSGDEIKTRPLNEKGYREGTCRKMMLDALQETGYNSFYEDTNLIMNIYWAWPAPDIGDLEEKILRHYDKTQVFFRSIPNKNRESSLNTQLRLYYHLVNVSYPCRKEDFKIVNDAEVLEDQDLTWKEMCRLANDPEITYHSILD